MCFEIFFAECKKKHSTKSFLKKHSTKKSVKKNTRQRASLPSVKKTLGKGVFAECPKNNTRQTISHSAKSRSPVVMATCQLLKVVF